MKSLNYSKILTIIVATILTGSLLTGCQPDKVLYPDYIEEVTAYIKLANSVNAVVEEIKEMVFLDVSDFPKADRLQILYNNSSDAVLTVDEVYSILDKVTVQEDFPKEIYVLIDAAMDQIYSYLDCIYQACDDRLSYFLSYDEEYYSTSKQGFGEAEIYLESIIQNFKDAYLLVSSDISEEVALLLPDKALIITEAEMDYQIAQALDYYTESMEYEVDFIIGGEVYKSLGTYCGELENRVPHGNGQYFDYEGHDYDGAWLDGLPHGHGTYYDSETGDTFVGIWESGEFIKVQMLEDGESYLDYIDDISNFAKVLDDIHGDILGVKAIIFIDISGLSLDKQKTIVLDSCTAGKELINKIAIERLPQLEIPDSLPDALSSLLSEAKTEAELYLNCYIEGCEAWIAYVEKDDDEADELGNAKFEEAEEHFDNVTYLLLEASLLVSGDE